MSVRRCTNCAAYRHCLKAAIRGKDAIRQHCHEWKPLPGLDTKEKKPVAGCEYCRLPVALYQTTHDTKLSLGTFVNARTLEVACEPCPPHSQCSSRGRTFRAAFAINYCPHCGRDLRGD